MPSVSGKWSCTIDQHGADGRSGWKLVCGSMVIGAGMRRCIGHAKFPASGERASVVPRLAFNRLADTAYPRSNMGCEDGLV